MVKRGYWRGYLEGAAVAVAGVVLGAVIAYSAVRSVDAEAERAAAMVVPEVFTINGDPYTFPEGVDELTVTRGGAVRAPENR